MASNNSATLFIAGATNGVQLIGSWDASTGIFPGSGGAQVGWLYKVSVGGTVDGVTFVSGDSVYAITSGASTSVFANNWIKVSSGDAVGSVFNRVGLVTATEGDYSLGQMSDVDLTVPPVNGNLLKFNGTQWVAGVATASSGATYSGEVPDVTARLALTDSPGQMVWQQDAGKKHRGGMYQQIRSPGTSNANWILLAEKSYSVTFDATDTTFDSTEVTWDATA